MQLAAKMEIELYQIAESEGAMRDSVALVPAAIGASIGSFV